MKVFGRRCRVYGLTALKRNAYFNLKYGFPGWIRTLPFTDYLSLRQRSNIGFNVHNRGDYGFGNYRLSDIPGNGVMQMSDGDRHLEAFFEAGKEMVRYIDADDLVDKLRYHLDHDAERQAVALNGYRRVMGDHRFHDRMRRAGELIQQG